MSRPRLVLAYSGGLDTSVLVRWLTEKGYDVVAFLADLGQEVEPQAVLFDRAKKAGAVKVFAHDLKKEFMQDFIMPMVQANARYETHYLLGTSIARPLIAKAQVEVAKKEHAQFLAHGATGKGNDQIRFELSYYACGPEFKVIAPWRVPEFYKNLSNREACIDYAKKFNIPITHTKKKPWSCDENMFHISYEGGILEDPNKMPPEEMWRMTVSPKKAPNKSTFVKIEFQKGVPVKLDEQKLAPADILLKLNEIAGKNGVGRVDLLENRFVGMKSRGCYETPGGTVLHAAYRLVESIAAPASLIHARDRVAPEMAELIYNGFWFSRRRKELQKISDEVQTYVTGEASLELYKGNVIVAGRSAKKSLQYKHSAFAMGKEFDPKEPERLIARCKKEL